nr:amidophosphoribosyltransferase [Negativicutes bacterium]
DKLIGVRDAYGFRPLCIGKIGNGFVIASESCALDAVGAEFLRDVLPGEIVMIDENGMTSFFLPQKRPSKLCVFEYIYFARPDSTIDGISVWQARYRMGQRLAKEFPLDADIVIPVPDTGIAAAIGLAAESGIPYKEGLIKNRYIGRTFILPDQSKRDAMVKMKLNPIRATLEGQRVILVDDSIVRGTTSAKLISLLREAGAKEVHMCVSSPPITHPCYYGIDTSIRKELIAATYSIEEIRQQIGADSLNYLSPEGLLRAVCDEGEEILCSACFSGKYPTDVSECEEEGHKLEFGKD